MIKSIKTEIRKNLYLPFLLFSVAAFMVLFMMSEAVRGTDGKAYSVFRIIQLRKHLRLTSDTAYSWNAVWSAGMGTWVMLIAPVILSAGFIFSGSEESSVNCERFIKIRGNRLRYVSGKVIGGMLSAGFTFAFSYGLYGLLILPLFPFPGEFDEVSRETLTFLYGENQFSFVAGRLFGVFLLGIFMSIVPVILSALISDRYILISVPFLGWYFYERLFSKYLFNDFFISHYDYFEAVNMANLPYVMREKEKLLALMVFMGSCVACFALYYFLKFGRLSEEK